MDSLHGGLKHAQARLLVNSLRFAPIPYLVMWLYAIDDFLRLNDIQFVLSRSIMSYLIVFHVMLAYVCIYVDGEAVLLLLGAYLDA